MNLKELYAKRKELVNKGEEIKNDPNAKLEEITNTTKEIKTIDAKIKLALETREEEKEKISNKIDKGEVMAINKNETKTENVIGSKEYNKAFFNVIRKKRVTDDQYDILKQARNGLSSGTGEDGGYLLPEDQKTAIKELKREMKTLESEVYVEHVTTNTGSRNREKDAEHTPMIEFGENADIADSDTPQFVNTKYVIKDRGAFMLVPNSLMNDNTANLKLHLNKWLAKKQVATRNGLIIALLRTLPVMAISGVADIKTALNTKLDPAIKDLSKIYTNQDGFDAMDNWVDDNGRPLLQPCPSDENKMKIAGKIIEVYSNKIMKTVAGKAPVFVGSMNEAITLFDRDALTIDSTNVGGDAFRRNETHIRGITREDVKFNDDSAMVFGEILLS